MATINEMVYDVREGVNKYSDDSDLSDRYIIHKINTLRNKFLSQVLNSFKAIKGNGVMQKLCMEFEEVDSAVCGNFSCNTILKSKDPIPDTLQLVTTQSILRVKPVDILSKKISFTTLDRIEFVGGSSFPNSLYSFIDVDDNMYVYSEQGDYKNLNCLEITGIFADPLELQNYKKCCDCNDSDICFDPNVEDYPVFEYMINDIVENVIKQLIISERIPSDRENNADEL